MSVLKKLVTLVRGSARELGQSMVDGNATRIYEQEIHDAKASIAQARGELTAVMAQEMQTARDIERIQSDIRRHEDIAIQVLDKAEQGAADELLAEKVAARVAALEGELHQQTTTHAGLVMQIGKLKELIRTAEQRIREHEREISIAKTTESVYRATQSISDSMGTTGSRIASARESLERIKQRHQTQADRIVAADTLERRRAAELRPFVQETDWLLDLHSMHEPCAPLLLTGVHPRNRALAQQLGAPAHVVIDAGHKDGTRLRDYGRFGLPDDAAPETRSLLIECGFHGDPASRDVARDQCARFLQAAGIVSADTLHTALPGWRGPDAAEQWALTVTEPVVAKSSNFRFVAPFTGLEYFEAAGTLIGDNDGEPVRTPYDHCVLVMPSVRQARAGVTVVRFARREALLPRGQ